MKINKSITTIVLFALGCLTVYTQDIKVEQAIKVLRSSNPKYIDAIKIYEKVIEDGGIEDANLFIKIASAYYFDADYASASKWFEKYYNLADVTPLPIYNYRYGQSLKVQKKYKKADALLAPYYESTGERYIYSNTIVDKISDNNNDRYEMIPFEHNTNHSDYSAYLHKDKLYFISNNIDDGTGISNKYTSDIYFIDGTKKEVEKPKGELNSTFNEGSLVMTRDGNTMYFTRNAFLSNKYKKTKKGSERVVTLNIYKAERINGEWKNITSLSINNPNYSVGHPALSFDEKTLYFSSDMPGGKGETDLYSVIIKDNGSLGKPKNLEALNTISKEMFPFIDPENYNLYFSSNRPSSFGGMDVFISKIEGNGAYIEAYNIGKPINSSFDDFAYMINTSKQGYFSSNRKSKNKLDEIYSFKEEFPFSFPVFLSVNGIAKSRETGQPISNVRVSLYDKESRHIETVVSNTSGEYVFKSANSEAIAFVVTEKEGFLNVSTSLNPNELVRGNPKFNLKLISSQPNQSKTIAINGKIKDKNATTLQSGISDVNVTFYDINEKIIAKSKTDAEGRFDLDAIDRRKVTFARFEKEGHLTEEVHIDGSKTNRGSLNLEVSLSTSKIVNEKGTNIAAILNTIYFDTGKSDIRTDAKTELEKIVQVLSQYPALSIEVGSHTDSQSSSIFNQKLSQLRAKSTYNYLVSRGVNPTQLSYKGYGETQLLNKCRDGVRCSELENQLNRRSEFLIKSNQMDKLADIKFVD